MSDIRIGVSAGTAHVLRLSRLAIDVLPTTAYLLVGERCVRDCAFCAQARSSKARTDLLSRITWPAKEQTAILKALAEAYRQGMLRRACLQVTTGPQSLAQAKQLAQAIHQSCSIPICAAVLPASLSQAEELLAAGVEVIGFGLDAATPEVYRQMKGWTGYSPASKDAAWQGAAEWHQQMALIEEMAQHHPGRVSVHLIVGLGESERDMAYLMQHLADLGVIIALFAFTPVPGTIMERVPPPPLAVYRRLQVARHLIVTGHSRAERFTYDPAGHIRGFGLPNHTLTDLLADGVAFQTSGCPDCNRPYYNERPGQVPFNYARPLSPAESSAAISLALSPPDGSKDMPILWP